MPLPFIVFVKLLNLPLLQTFMFQFDQVPEIIFKKGNLNFLLSNLKKDFRDKNMQKQISTIC